MLWQRRRELTTLNEVATSESLDLQATPVDVSVPDEVKVAVEAVAAARGGVDTVVNLAAVHPYGDAIDTDFDTFTKCMQVNVGSILLTAKHAAPHMRRRGGGVIANLASVQGYNCQAGVTAYVASKGAILTITRALAFDFAADQIRVVSVSPGSILRRSSNLPRKPWVEKT